MSQSQKKVNYALDNLKKQEVLRGQQTSTPIAGLKKLSCLEQVLIYLVFVSCNIIHDEM